MWNTGIIKQAVTHYLKQKRKAVSHLQLSVESCSPVSLLTIICMFRKLIFIVNYIWAQQK